MVFWLIEFLFLIGGVAEKFKIGEDHINLMEAVSGKEHILHHLESNIVRLWRGHPGPNCIILVTIVTIITIIYQIHSNEL